MNRMIQIKTSIHDRFSVEFKINFSGQEQHHHLFKMNLWLFVPNSLNINAATYAKDQFYRDVKSNVRLKTPVFTLEQMADPDSVPVKCLKQALAHYESDSSKYSDLEFHVKMYVAIFKSALRDETRALQSQEQSQLTDDRVRGYLDAIRQITSHYRTVMATFAERGDDLDPLAVFAMGDEYMSHLAELHATRLLRHTDKMGLAHDDPERQMIADSVAAEHQYKIAHGYAHFNADSVAESRDMFQRQNTLKKYVESALYLKSDTGPDGAAAQQLTFSVAAGIAMLVSMLIALPFQKYLGQYPTLIFIILVIAYMLKDRIKEYARNRFAHRLKAHYFDMKSKVFFRGKKVVHIKEGMDYIGDDKIPAEVLRARHRSALDNSIPLEQAMLYRKQVDIDNAALREHYEYSYDGINDITRIHLQYLTLKMDDPMTTISVIDETENVRMVEVPRVYNIYIVLQCTVEGTTEYYCFKLMTSRNGIEACVEA